MIDIRIVGWNRGFENSAESPASSGFTSTLASKPLIFPLSAITTRVVYSYHMLDLRSKARQQLLAYYFTNPTARHHLRDLAERLSLDPSNLSKELGRLMRDGLFRSEMSGRQKYFQLNRGYPLLNEVRKIVAKTIGAAPLIAQSLKRIEGIDEAYLYGSFASNQQDAASDIDVLVIGSPREKVLAQAVEGWERQLGREINFTPSSRPKESRVAPRSEGCVSGKRLAQ